MPKFTALKRHALPERLFACPAPRREPLKNASHFCCAPARFDLVQGMTDGERDETWRRIEVAANANAACSCADPGPDAEMTKSRAAFLKGVKVKA